MRIGNMNEESDQMESHLELGVSLRLLSTIQSKLIPELYMILEPISS
jgi:hypothetical protein